MHPSAHSYSGIDAAPRQGGGVPTGRSRWGMMSCTPTMTCPGELPQPSSSPLCRGSPSKAKPRHDLPTRAPSFAAALDQGGEQRNAAPAPIPVLPRSSPRASTDLVRRMFLRLLCLL